MGEEEVRVGARPLLRPVDEVLEARLGHGDAAEVQHVAAPELVVVGIAGGVQRVPVDALQRVQLHAGRTNRIRHGRRVIDQVLQAVEGSEPRKEGRLRSGADHQVTNVAGDCAVQGEVRARGRVDRRDGVRPEDGPRNTNDVDDVDRLPDTEVAVSVRTPRVEVLHLIKRDNSADIRCSNLSQDAHRSAVGVDVEVLAGVSDQTVDLDLDHLTEGRVVPLRSRSAEGREAAGAVVQTATNLSVGENLPTRSGQGSLLAAGTRGPVAGRAKRVEEVAAAPSLASDLLEDAEGDRLVVELVVNPGTVLPLEKRPGQCVRLCHRLYLHRWRG